MEFTVEFYETEARRRPVEEFLQGLKADDPGDFAAVVAGLAKLRNRQNHREPLSKAIGGGLFGLRHVGKLNTRVLWLFMKGRPRSSRITHHASAKFHLISPAIGSFHLLPPNFTSRVLAPTETSRRIGRFRDREPSALRWAGFE